MTEPADQPASRPRPSPGGAHRAEPAAEAEPAVEAPVEPQPAAGTDAAGHGEQPANRPGLLHRWAESGRAGSRRAGFIALGAGLAAVAVVVVLVVVLVRGGSSGPAATAVANPQAELSDSSGAQAFVAGATSDVQSVTSYSYLTLPSDLANGLAVTTGAYRTRYRAALSGSVGATARRLHRTQTFQLATAGIGSTSADGRTAHVLIFGTQGVRDDTTDGRTQDSLITLDATVRRTGSSYLISGLEIDGNAGLPPGTAGLTAAAEAARAEVAALLTLRRAHLTADAQAVLAGAVGPLRTQLAARTASVRSAVERSGDDLTGVVTSLAVGSADGDTATMLVAATGDRTSASGSSSVVTDGRYVITVVRVQGRWLVSALAPVAVAD